MSDRDQEMFELLVKNIDQQICGGRERSAIVAELVEAGMPEPLARQFVARVARMRRVAQRDGVRGAYAEVAGLAFVKGMVFVVGGGVLTAVTLAIPLPFFVVFTGAIVVGAFYLLIAAWYGLRWLLGV